MTLLSNNIREYRFRNGEMTQKALAERVGISRQTMNAIENCRHAPTVVVAIRMADVFHASVDRLFNLEYDGKPAQRQQVVSVAIDRPQPTIDESMKYKVEHEPSEEESSHGTSFAALRHVV